METILTALVIIILLAGLIYMATDILGKRKSGTSRVSPARKSQNSKPMEEKRKLIGHHPLSLPQDNPVASRNELMEFWTSVMNDKSNPIETRLKASELLGFFYTEGMDGRR